MKTLKKFIAQENTWASLFNRPALDVNNITESVAQELFKTLDNRLSPESISCDGEATRAQIQRKYTLYTGAINDLCKMGFTPKEQMYSI